MDAYETVIGLEVHAQLLTRTKAFCACATSFGDPPNVHTCPVCLGLPGALPVLNEEAVRMAASAALALGCELQRTSVFARKNYFYPDLPKGYQISQYDKPLALHGAIDIGTEAGPRHARVLRVHMEEDAGKTVHGHGEDSIVDLNRAGTPLIEIVGEPDLRSGLEAMEYLKRLREILMFIGVNDGNLEQGSFRCDANVSVRPVGEAKLGTRTELKNINSFRFVADAIDVEARRQVALLSSGQRVRQETRGYHPEKRETFLLRDKENESGYRYFPDPDLPPLLLDDELLREVRDALPETASARRERYVKELGVTAQAAQVLTGHPEIAAFFEATVRLLSSGASGASGANERGVRAANFIQSELLRDVKTTGLTAEIPVSPKQVAELLRAVAAGAISGKQAKDVYARMRGTKALPDAIIREQGMGVVNDETTLRALALDVTAKNPKQAAGYRAGKTNLLGYFVGLIMKETRGSADPAAVNRVLKDVLEGGGTAEAEVPAPTSLASSGAASTPTMFPPTPQVTYTPRPRPGEAASPLAESVVPPAPSHGVHNPRADRERTLTSASVGIALLASLRVPTPDEALADALSRIDLRIGSVLFAAHVPGDAALIDLAVDVGETSPVRVLQSLGKSSAPEDLVGKRVLVARNATATESARGGSSDDAARAPIDALLVCAHPVASSAAGLVLVTVLEDVAPGTRVGASAPPRPPVSTESPAESPAGAPGSPSSPRGTDPTA